MDNDGNKRIGDCSKQDAGYLIGAGFIGMPALPLLGMEHIAEKALLNRKLPDRVCQEDQGANTNWARHGARRAGLCRPYQQR